MNKLIVSSSPHIKTKNDTPRIMLDVIIALMPTFIAGAIIYGLSSLLVVATCVLTCVVSEFVFNLIVKKEQTVFDLSAIVTGLILSLSLHAYTPVWQCVIGGIFATIVVKCLFGGLGANFANPAATARVFMLICFTKVAGGAVTFEYTGEELITSATPLANLKNGGSLPSLLDMFLGVREGAIGEACILALVIGFIYLVVRGVIKFEVPLVMVATVFLLYFIVTKDVNVALYQILSGGLVFGAVFMATDYVTTPATRLGKIIFAFGAGLITFLIRMYSGLPEGVSYAIVLMNILAPAIELLTKPKALVKRGKN